MTPGNAFGILIVLTGGASLLIVTLATAAAVIRSFRPDRPEPAGPPTPAPALEQEPEEGDVHWWINATQLHNVRDVMVAYGVTTLVDRHRVGGRG